MLFILSPHITSYQVTAGPLAKNQTYTGLVLREEQVITAESSGRVTYYAENGTRVSKNGPIYSVHAGEVDPDEYKPPGSLRSCGPEIRSLLGGFDPLDFREIYSLKTKLSYSLLTTSAGSESLAEGSLTNAAGDLVMTAPTDGILSYNIDSYEDFALSNLSWSTFNERREKNPEVRPGDSVVAGQEIYKLITSETWTILVPLTSKQVVHLDSMKTIRVKFLKDGRTQVASLTIRSMEDGGFYGQLTFSSGMLRYLGDRFLQVELVTNTETGLKVPLTSLTSRNFLMVPESYMTKGGDGNTLGLMKILTDEDGRDVLSFIKATICGYIDGEYYIEADNFHLGDRIAEPAPGNRKMVISQTGALDGVYSMNKGYAIFRCVEILDKNEDYCIVRKGTRYGIVQFDFIVLDASGVKEEEITAT